MLILGIETSCDETAAALIKGENSKIKVLSNVVSSHVKIHARWGGVVPSLAAREHEKNIIPVLEKVFSESQISAKEISLISITNGPGLIPALLIGTSCAKTLACVWQKPLLGIHHIEGHIYANFIENEKNNAFQKTKIKFPLLCLVVSGGHTQLVLMKNHLQYKIIGQTLDDAAGEAFDKTARLLELGYPGGPAIAKAAKFKIQNPKFKVNLPRPMLNKNNFNFSFSGLKTAVLYEVKKYQEIKNKKDAEWKNYTAIMACEFQQAVIDVLIAKTIKAAQQYKVKTIMLAGGVSANQELRKQLGQVIQKKLKNVVYKIPALKYSLDNAAMIAAASYFRWKKMNAQEKKKALKNWQFLKTDANLKMKSLKK